MQAPRVPGHASFLATSTLALLLLRVMPAHGGGSQSLRQAAAAKVVRDAAMSEAAQCGVSGVLKDGHMEKPTSLKPSCGKMYQTNCSVSYYPMACPSDCEYIVPNKAFTCIFECAAPDGCSTKNPNTAFPDPTMKVCRKCKAVGCKICETDEKCRTCHHGFELRGDSCSFSLFLKLEPPISMLLIVFGIIAGLLFLFGLCWHCVKIRHWDDPHREVNTYSIERSRMHRHLVKVVRWQLGDRKKVTEHYSMFTNLHVENILGIGIALFYNSMLFMICFSLLIFFVTFIAYTASRASAALSQFDPDDWLLLRRSVRPASGWPAVVLSRLSVCSAERQETLQDDLSWFYVRNYYAMAILYVLAFGMTLAHTFFQKQFIVWFNSQNATMSDYALSVKGLPTDLTDEGQLREWLQKEFRSCLPSSQKRPSNVVEGGTNQPDTVTPRADSQVEVYGVSICYNYTDKEEEVDRMVEEMNMRFEVEEAQKTGKGLRAGFVGGPFLLKSQREEHRKKVTEWFEGSDRMVSTGKAFVVFRYSADKDSVLKYYRENPDALTYKDGNRLEVKAVDIEPPSVRWGHMGVPKETVHRNFWMTVAKSLLLVLAFQLFIFIPYAYFILLPFSRIGTESGGVVIEVAGIALGALNSALSVFIRDMSWRVGFHTKENSETLVLSLNILVTLVNTCLNLGILTYTIASQNGEQLLDLIYSESLSSISTLNSVARGIYLTMMPGNFFVGYLLLPFISGVMPYLQTTLFMKLIYIWRVFPRCMLQVLRPMLPYAPDSLDRYPYYCAEKAMEPNEVDTSDYADLFTIPTICCSMLFFLSPFVWKTFFWMLVWSAFIYVFIKFKHLRLEKASFCTSDRSDRLINYLWGLPLSIIAMAWFFWGYHAGKMGDLKVWAVMLLMVLVFAFSWTAWGLCYHFVVRPGQRTSSEEVEVKTVEEVKASTLYCWMNCNPVFTLKCEYYYLSEDGVPLASKHHNHPLASGEDPSVVRFYTPGKQYLFIKAERQHLATLQPDVLEFETYLERALALLGMVMGLCAARTESSVRDYFQIANEEETAPKKQVVVIKETFMSSNRDNSMELVPGLEGYLQRMDSSGDALLRFDGVETMQWVDRKNFDKVKGLEQTPSQDP